MEVGLLTVSELIKFENEIKKHWLNGEIRAPIHFSGGNEKQLIEIFKDIKPEDWVFTGHRSHYHALLKGIPKEWIRQEIFNRHSIDLNNAKYKFFVSSILGGIIPIALGVAWAIKRREGKEHVWVFVGDMAAEMGAFYECSMYACRQDLPITFVIEDDDRSVASPTQKVWGEHLGFPDIKWYTYKNKYPHQGVGKYVLF